MTTEQMDQMDDAKRERKYNSYIMCTKREVLGFVQDIKDDPTQAPGMFIACLIVGAIVTGILTIIVLAPIVSLWIIGVLMVVGFIIAVGFGTVAAIAGYVEFRSKK